LTLANEDTRQYIIAEVARAENAAQQDASERVADMSFRVQSRAQE
jgi:hypothetical protein